MANSSMPPSLQVISADGDMIDAEISSDAGHSHNDIDIDIDLSGTPHGINDDIDYMMDDTDAQQEIHPQHVQPQIANDDNMIDEIEDIETPEEVMIDEITVPEDDAAIGSTLDSQNNPDAFFDEIDFDDNEPYKQHDISGEPSTAENLVETTSRHGATEQPALTDEAADSHQFTSGHHGRDESLTAAAAEENTGGSQQKDVKLPPLSSGHSPEKKSDEPVASPENLSSPAKAVSSNVAKPSEDETAPQPNPSALDNVGQTHVAGHASDGSHDKHGPSANAPVTYDDQTVENTYTDDAEDLRTAHYIPTIVVDFNDEQFSLFPPLTGDTQLQQYESFYSLIDDTQLASKNINELFAVLRINLGNSVAVDEELEFQVHDLGLNISEVCCYARKAHTQGLKPSQTCTECFNFSFEMICDLFHRLNYNDGESNAQPLFVTLIKKPRFSSRFLKLQDAADQGLGRSSIDFLQTSEEEWDTEQHEDVPYDEGQKEDEAQAVFEGSGESVFEDPTAPGDDSHDLNQGAESHDLSNLGHDGESQALENETQDVAYTQEQDFNFEDPAWENQATEGYDSVSERYDHAQLGSPVEAFEQAAPDETTAEGYAEEGDDLFDFGDVGEGDVEASSGSHTLGDDEADRSCQWSEILISDDGLGWLTWELDSDDKPAVDEAQTEPSEAAQLYTADENPEDEHLDSNDHHQEDTQSADFPDTEGSHFDSAENHTDDPRRDKAANNLDAEEFNDDSGVQDQQWHDFQADEFWEGEDGGDNPDGHPGAANVQEPDPRDDLGSPHDDGNYQATNDSGQHGEVRREGVTDDDDFLIDWSDNEEETKPSVAKPSTEPLPRSALRKRSYDGVDSDVEDPAQDQIPPKRTRVDTALQPDSFNSPARRTIESGPMN